MRLPSALLAAGLFLATFTPAAERTLLHCGRLIDAAAGETREQMTIVVISNRLAAVEAGYALPVAGDAVIDLKARTVLPGLIDLHVHLQSDHGPQRYLERFQFNPEDNALLAAYHARVTLRAGFTTVRDLGGEQFVALRNAISKGIAEGPRIVAAGRAVAVTGGHADPSNVMRRDL